MKRITPILVLILILGVMGISGCIGSDSNSSTQGSSNSPQGDSNSSYSTPASTTPAPITLSGTGQEATKTFHLSGGLTRFEMTHNGDSNFIIHLMDTNGNTVEYVVNEIGAYSGSQAFNVMEGDYILNVDADGSWTVKIIQS